MFQQLIALEQLRLEFNRSSVPEFSNIRNRLNNSGLERTVGLFRRRGEKCPFVQKSLTLFTRDDYQEIKQLLSVSAPKIFRRMFPDG